MDKNRRSISEFSKLEDANFMVEAASYNLLEQGITELAETRGYSSALVQLARKNSEEHEHMKKQLNKLARKKKIKLPAEMKSEHRLMLDQLSTAGQSEFDRAFVSTLEKVNEENTALYETKSSQADDADIRAFAARNLGMLRMHATELSKVNDQLLHTHN